ncbi:MAG: hypothetical protein M3680_31645, partial [Myxococcota bacterium]|nr:hypothetical protein [Myxococcota bacterium]
MSTPKPPPGGGKGQKPFLGADDLFSELDAWDQTFDALHGGMDAGEIKHEPVMEWPVPESPDPTALTMAAPGDPGTSFDQLPQLDDELEAQLTLDAPLDPPTVGGRTHPTYADPGETDFSAIGAAEPPAALGDLLGRSSTALPLDEVEPTRVRRPAPTGPPVDDDEVYTSASRPNRAPPALDSFDDDALAPPPMPEVRRFPAIVRRVTAATPVPRVPEEITPPQGTNLGELFGSENTVIADYDAIARSSARSQGKTAPPPLEEDDYADIEIGADDASAQPEAIAEPVGQRRTAHVFRREITTKSPPMRLDRIGSAPVIEMEIDEELSAPIRTPRSTGGEADFSDLDPSDDLALPLAAPAAAPASRGYRPATFDLDADAAPSAALDDALGGLDDPDSFDAGRDSFRDFDDAPHDPADDEGSAGAYDTRGHADAAAGDEQGDQYDVPLDGAGDEHLDEQVDESLVESEAEADASQTLGDSPLTAVAQVRDSGASDRDLPTLADGDDPQASARPPALTDLYPRIKTPTSVPPLGVMPDVRRPVARATASLPVMRQVDELTLDGEPQLEPVLDLDVVGRAWPEQVEPLPTSALDEASAAALLVYEREVATLDDSEGSAALRIEAGR